MKSLCLTLLACFVAWVHSCTIAIVNDPNVTNATLPSILRNFPGCSSSSVLNITIMGVNLPTISESTFSGLTTLQSIRISNTNLASVPPLLLRNLAALSYLSLANNMITTLPAYFLDGNTNLGTVQLNRNSLTTIAPNAFCCGAPVTSLDLGFNSLTGFDTDTFRGMSALASLGWNSNNLQPSNLHASLLAMAPIAWVNVTDNPSLVTLPAGIFSGGGASTNITVLMDSNLRCSVLGLPLACNLNSACALCRDGVIIGLGCCFYPTAPTSSPTKFPTVAPTMPTLSPTTRSPTRSPVTLSPTLSPSTASPTRAPTSSPTTGIPTTGFPTANPTTDSPTGSPTTESPTSLSPSTAGPSTSSPTTRVPTLMIAELGAADPAAAIVWLWYVIAAVALVVVAVVLVLLWRRRKKHLERRAFIASESTANSDSSSSGFRSETSDSPSHSAAYSESDISRSGTLSRDASVRGMGTMLEIDGKEIEMGPKLGNGAFGSVHQCLWRGTDYAMKSLLKPSQEAAFEKEVEVNRQLSAIPHIHVTRMVGVSRNPVGIVMELYPMGSVEDYLRSNLRAPEDFAHILTILITASAGMMHLHSQGIVHRDIAARNFLIKKDYSAAVCDFGLAVVIPEGKTFGTRTVHERETDLLPINITSPEALNQGQYSTASDVFMFGMFIWEVLTRQIPHGNRPEFASNPKDFLGFIQRVIHHDLRPTIPQDWPAALRILVLQCWERKPELRPTLSQINHTLRNVRAEVLASKTPLPAVGSAAKSSPAAAVADPNLYYEHTYSNSSAEESQAGPYVPPPPATQGGPQAAAHYSPGAMYRAYGSAV